MMHFLINPTWRCQNTCSYCWMQQTVANRSMYRVQERPVEDWYEALKRDRPELVDIAGGEPLLLDWVPDLMLAARSLQFGLSTNGLRTEGIDALCRRRIPNLISINVSYHPECNVSDYGARFRESISRLRAAGYAVHTNVVSANGNVAVSTSVIGWLRSEGVPVEVSPYERMDDLGTLLPQGLRCQGGSAHLNVAPDGESWPCLTTMRSPYWESTSIGNWLDGTIDINRKAQPCYLDCVDYYVLKHQHPAGDMWGIRAVPE